MQPAHGHGGGESVESVGGGGVGEFGGDGGEDRAGFDGVGCLCLQGGAIEGVVEVEEQR